MVETLKCKCKKLMSEQKFGTKKCNIQFWGPSTVSPERSWQNKMRGTKIEFKKSAEQKMISIPPHKCEC